MFSEPVIFELSTDNPIKMYLFYFDVLAHVFF